MPAHDFELVKPNIYHDLHGAWITAIKSALNNGILPRSFYALSEQSQGDVKPDVMALEMSANEAPARYGIIDIFAPEPKSPPAMEIMARTDGFLYGTRRKTLAIRHIDDHRVVALLELLSNSNKASPDQLNKLVAKVTDALIHGVHVSIVDPYPPNRHAPRGIHGIIWEELGERAETWPTEKPFTAVAYSSNQEIEAYAQPYGLGDTLPDLPLFLKPDFYVQVPLEQTYMEAFHTMPEYWRERLQEPRKRPNRKIA